MGLRTVVFVTVLTAPLAQGRQVAGGPTWHCTVSASISAKTLRTALAPPPTLLQTTSRPTPHQGYTTPSLHQAALSWLQAHLPPSLHQATPHSLRHNPTSPNPETLREPQLVTSTLHHTPPLSVTTPVATWLKCGQLTVRRWMRCLQVQQ
jgi:hypothetical protein